MMKSAIWYIAIGLCLSTSLLTRSAWAASGHAESGDSLRAMQVQYLECADAGRRDGQLVSAGGAFGIGLGSGFLLGPIGAGLATALQGNPPRPSAVALRTSQQQCYSGYLRAYDSAGRHHKRMVALSGGAIGTLVWFLLIL